MQLEAVLEKLVSLLEPHGEFLRKLSEEGIVRIWASTQGTRNYTLEVPPSMLTRLSSLGVAFVHDVYPCPEGGETCKLVEIRS
jgi:hypothetical protein